MNQQIGEHRQLVVGNEFDGGLGEQRQRARAGAAGVAGQRRSGRFSGEACYVAGQQYISWTLLLPYLGQHPIYFSTGRCRHEMAGTGDFTADPEKVLEVAVAEGMMQCPASALGVFGRAANNVHHWHMLGVTARDRIGHRARRPRMSLPPLTSHAAARTRRRHTRHSVRWRCPPTGWSGGPRCGRGIAGCSRRERRRSQRRRVRRAGRVGSRRRCRRDRCRHRSSGVSRRRPYAGLRLFPTGRRFAIVRPWPSRSRAT